jgi:hypothetical protein
LDRIDLRIARQLPGQGCEHVMLLIHALAQRRQRGLRLGKCGILGKDVCFSDRAQIQFASSDLERLALERNNLLGGFDLRAITGFLDGGAQYIGDEGQVSRVVLESAYVN